MNLQEKLLREALGFAVTSGIEICSSATFSWRDQQQLEACNAFGALLLRHGKEKVPGWQLLQDLLEVDSIWLYRFNIGFGIGNRLQIAHCNRAGEICSYTEDEVNALGLKLRKEFVNNYC